MRAVFALLLLFAVTPATAQSLSRNDIIQVQGLLADMGYRAEVGTVDGLMGPGTSAAITAFQRETGMAVTGQPSPDLIARLQQLNSQGWDRGAVVSTGPSFDCGRASVPSEYAICADARLSRLDRDVSQAYAAALNRSARDADIRAAQRRWLSLRNDCGSDRRCLDNAMTGQISVLQRY